MTIKRKIQTKYRLPNLNWIALKPQQVKGTVFCELDDEKLLDLIDFNRFEELFKTGPATNANGSLASALNGNGHSNGPDSPSQQRRDKPKKPENITLLDAQRQRNLGK